MVLNKCGTSQVHFNLPLPPADFRKGRAGGPGQGQGSLGLQVAPTV